MGRYERASPLAPSFSVTLAFTQQPGDRGRDPLRIVRLHNHSHARVSNQLLDAFSVGTDHCAPSPKCFFQHIRQAF